MAKPHRLLFLLLAWFWTAAAPAAGPEALRQAAEAGDAEAQMQLGTLYEYGYHLPDNEAPALAWYTLAAEQGHAKAAARRDALRARLQPATIEQAAALATQWRVAKPTTMAVPGAADVAAPAIAESPAPAPAAVASDLPADALDAADAAVKVLFPPPPDGR